MTRTTFLFFNIFSYTLLNRLSIISAFLRASRREIVVGCRTLASNIRQGVRKSNILELFLEKISSWLVGNYPTATDV